jgi:hypothetical protein
MDRFALRSAPCHHAVNDEALDTIFRAARTQNKWQDKPVSPRC